MRHGKHLGLTEPFMHRLVQVVADAMGNADPDIRANRPAIEKTILAEENRFEAVLTEGLPRLEAELAKALETPDRILAGDVAFRLYDTFGVPYDFIEDTAATQDVKVDRAGYDAAMEAQRHRARAGSAFAGAVKGDEFALDETSLNEVGDQFEGYSATQVRGVPIVAMFDEHRRPVAALASGATGYAA